MEPNRSASRTSSCRAGEDTSLESNYGDHFPQEPWLSIGGGKPFPPRLPDLEAYVVDFDGPHDPLNPFNWSSMTKYVIPMSLLSSLTDCCFKDSLPRPLSVTVPLLHRSLVPCSPQVPVRRAKNSSSVPRLALSGPVSTS